MDIKIIDLSKNKKEIKVTIPVEEIKKHTNKAVELISSEVKIDGFRPGKAPEIIVEEKVGKTRIWNESCYQVLNETYSKILEENNFFIISTPQINVESMEVEKPLEYKITIDILPEIKLPEYKEIAEKTLLSEKKEVKVEEKEIEKTISEIQKSRAKTKNVSRIIKDQDEVVVSFEGSVDNVKQKELKKERVTFIVGEHDFIKGFSENLIDMKSGDKKTFTIETETLDKDKKQGITFSVEIHDVREREIPELNDEFAVSLGHFKDLSDLKEKIKENIKFEKEFKEKEKIRIKIIENISDKTEINIPDLLIEKELNNMITEYKEQLSNSGLSFQDYLNQIKKSEDEIKKDWRERAGKRLKASLILQEIARKEKINVTTDEIEKETSSYLNRINQEGITNTEKEKIKLFIKDIIQNEKVFEVLENK